MNNNKYTKEEYWKKNIQFKEQERKQDNEIEVRKHDKEQSLDYDRQRVQGARKKLFKDKFSG
jgi:hypothetical protein